MNYRRNYILYIVVVSLLVACSKSFSQTDLIGKWNVTSTSSYNPQPGDFYYQFNPDGTFYSFEDLHMEKNPPLTMTGTYEIKKVKEDQILSLKGRGPSHQWKIMKHTSKSLELESYGGNKMVLVKE